jgi:hypothetical protein
MEIALLVGKYVLVALIYLFVYVVYRGLIAEARADREEAAARQARAEVPRMTGPVGPVTPRRAAETAASAAPTAPAVSVAPVCADSPAPVGPAAPPEPVSVPAEPVVSSAESVRAALVEEGAPEEAAAEEKHVPALLARELPREVAAAEGLAPSRPEESVMEALAEAGAREPEAESPATPLPGPEPGTLVVSPTTPRLVVLHSESVELPPGREYPLLAAATIGRAAHNLVVLPDTFVSSQHALIFLKEGRRVLRDRGSTNGTLVNGHRISGDHLLRDGDQIMVGTTLLRYVEPE